MKIIAVGMNYPLHCRELHAGEPLPKEPVIFMKPDSALLKDSKPFFIPDFCEQVDYETELVVRINRLGKNIAERFAHRYYDAVTVGIASATGCRSDSLMCSASVSVWILTERRCSREIRPTCFSGWMRLSPMSAVSVR